MLLEVVRMSSLVEVVLGDVRSFNNMKWFKADVQHLVHRH